MEIKDIAQKYMNSEENLHISAKFCINTSSQQVQTFNQTSESMSIEPSLRMNVRTTTKIATRVKRCKKIVEY